MNKANELLQRIVEHADIEPDEAYVVSLDENGEDQYSFVGDDYADLILEIEEFLYGGGDEDGLED